MVQSQPSSCTGAKNTESLLKDAEAGQRGYLYTGKLEYLAPYTLAVAQIDLHLANLAEQIGDNPREASRRLSWKSGTSKTR